MRRALALPIKRAIATCIRGAIRAGEPFALAGAPTGVSAVAGNAEATVSFTAPASTGDGPLTGYRVTASTGQTATGASSPITVTGLTNGTPVTFTVAAQNAGGYGPESAASASVTPVAESLGPELIVNGGFDSDTAWAKGTGWTISGGRANSTGSADLVATAFAAQTAGTFKLAFDVVSYSSGTGVRGWLTGTATDNFGTFRNAVGSYVEYITVTEAGKNGFRLDNGGTNVLSVDNVSLRKVL